jgi:high-affinity Fe2+/Pb2+ permease
MDNLNDLKKLWHTADTQSLPDSNEMLMMIKKYRNQKMVRKILLIACALVFAGLMVQLFFDYNITTRIGEAMIISSILILIVTNTRSLKRMYDLKNCTNKEFIAHLQQVLYNRNYYYTKTQPLCMGLNGVGFMIYMIETIHKKPFLGSVVFGVTIVFLLILLLVVRPRVFKKQSKKLNETIKRTNSLFKQFD